MKINWRFLLGVGLVISYPWLFKKLLGGVHWLWHPDALTYIAHPLFDVARISLASVCAAVVSYISAYFIVFILGIQARSLIWISIVLAAFVLYVLPFFEHDPVAVLAQLIRGGIGNLIMAVVVVCMPGIFIYIAIARAKKTLNTDAPKDSAAVV